MTSLSEIAPEFFKVTMGNIVTWLVMGGGWIAFWVKLKDKADATANRLEELEVSVNKRFDAMDKVMNEMITQGSPASRSSQVLTRSILESQDRRLILVEAAILDFAAIKADVGWMKEYLKTQIHK